MEPIQKPFEPKVLIELVEDITRPAALNEINRLISQFDPSKPNDEQIEQLLDVLRRAQKVGLCQ